MRASKKTKTSLSDTPDLHKLLIFHDPASFSKEVPFHTGYCHEHDTLVRAHTHTGFEFGEIVSGKGYMYLNGQFLPCDPGDVYFLDATLPHWHLARTGDNLVSIWVHLGWDKIISLMPDEKDLRIYEPFQWLRNGLSPIIKNRPDLFKEIAEINSLSSERQPDWDLKSWGKILYVVFQIAQYARPFIRKEAETASIKYNDVVTRAVQFLNEHYAEPVSRTVLARYCSISVSRLSHLFTEIMGMSLAQYRTRVRVNFAVEKIKTTSKKLYAIAQECGFGSESQLREAFVKTIGITPGSLRKDTAE
jgi:xylan 1,4-beta-xylosidase